MIKVNRGSSDIKVFFFLNILLFIREDVIKRKMKSAWILPLFLLCKESETWGGVDRGLLRCWGLSCLSVAWLITEANSKRIAGGNKDTGMSAVSFSEGPIRQVDGYWQTRDRKRETCRDEGEDREGGSVLKSLTLAQAAMSADPVAITLRPCPGYYLKPNKYQGLNVTTRTSEPHLHQSVSRVSNHPFSFLCRQIHLLHSYTLLHTPIRPLTTTLRGGTVQQIYDRPISGQARFIDISCQLSFWEIARRINFKYVLMLNILETLNFMVGDAQSRISIYHVLGLRWKTLFLDFNLIRSSS